MAETTKQEVKVVDRAYLLKQFQNYNTKVVQVAVDDLDSRKVEKVDGYGLSKNDFTDAYKEKVDSLAGDLTSRVEANEAALTTLRADKNTEGSIAKMTADAVASIVADAPEDLDTLKEISDWISGHADSAATMNTAIQQNATDIAALQEEVGNISVEDMDIDFDDLYGDGNPDITITGESSVVEGSHITLSASQADASWSSTNEAVATVADGVVTGVAAGTATIKAAKNGYTTGTKAVTVTAKPTVEIGGEEVEVNVGETITLTSNAANTIWSSSDDDIATVADGVVTGVAAGEVTITASAAGYNPGTKSITVKVVEAAQDTIAIGGFESTTLVAGNETSLEANVDGVTWSSSDEAIATVSPDGVVTSIAAGEVTITASKEGYTSGTVTFTVEVE